MGDTCNAAIRRILIDSPTGNHLSLSHENVNHGRAESAASPAGVVFLSPSDETVNNNDRILAFTRTKAGADRTARDLKELGVAAAAIHGDLPQRKREQSLERFAEGRIHVLVATNVAARGLHIRLVS